VSKTRTEKGHKLNYKISTTI